MRINPAISLISAFLYSLAFSFSNFEIYFLFPIFYLFYISKKNIFLILKKFLLLNIFIFILFLFVLYESSFLFAINIYLRASFIILFNVLIFYDSKGYDIVRGLAILSFPKIIVSTTFFTLKMIDNLRSDFKNITQNLKSRGFRADNSMFTYNTFGNVLGMLLVKSIKKSQSLNETLISRGFMGSIYLNDSFKIEKKDKILIVLILVMICIKVVDELFF